MAESLMPSVGASLRARVVLLAVLIAALATAMAAVAAGQAVDRALDQLEERRALQAQEALQRHVADVVHRIELITQDMATRDELYQQMGTAQEVWAVERVFARLPVDAASLVVVVADRQGRLVGRSGAAAAWGEALSAGGLAAVLDATRADRGLTLLAGHPALFVRRPVVAQAGQGDIRGYLVGLALVEAPEIRRWVSPPGWVLTWDAAPTTTTVVAATATHLHTTIVMPAVEGPDVAWHMESPRGEEARIRTRTVLAIYGTGAVAAAVAAVLGAVLAVHWLRPLRRLVHDCAHPGGELSDGGALEETRALAAALRRLLATERAARDDLAAALERTRHVAEVHRAFLGGLAQDIGVPVARLVGLLRHAVERGHLPPEGLAEAADVADLLERRLGDAAAVASRAEGAVPLRRVALATWLAEVIDLLRPEARRTGVEVISEGAGQADLPVGRLMPVLIDVVANAVHVTPPGGVVRVVATVGDSEVVITVTDPGPGLGLELGPRVVAACQRGEVLPGEPGFGLGLALALDRVRRLGGRLSVERSDAAGTVFSIRVPRQFPPPAPPETPPARHAAAPLPPAP